MPLLTLHIDRRPPSRVSAVPSLSLRCAHITVQNGTCATIIPTCTLLTGYSHLAHPVYSPPNLSYHKGRSNVNYSNSLFLRSTSLDTCASQRAQAHTHTTHRCHVHIVRFTRRISPLLSNLRLCKCRLGRHTVQQSPHTSANYATSNCKTCSFIKQLVSHPPVLTTTTCTTSTITMPITDIRKSSIHPRLRRL